MESYSVQAVLSAVDRNFSKTFASANKVADSFGNNTTKSTSLGGKGMIKFGAVAGAATAVVSKALSVITNNVGNAVDRFDTLNKYPVVMKALGYSTQDTNKSMKLLSNGIDGLPTSLNEITSAAQQFAPLTGGATSGAKAALALNDAFLASGASVADTSRGMQQYTQMLATGKVDMQSWRTLQETMPIALRKTANAFGFTGKSAEQDLFKALQSGQITIDDLNKKFVELDKGQNGFSTLARKNSVGIKTSFTNLGTAVTKGLADTLSAIDTGLKNAKLGGIADIINNMKGGIKAAFDTINSAIVVAVPIIVNSIKTMVDFVSANKDWLLPLAAGVAGFITAFMAINKVITIISAIKTAFTGLFAVLSANPFVLIVAAIIGVAAALVYFFTQTKIGQQIWQSFTTWLVTAWQWLATTAVSVWTSISTFFTTIWTGIVTGATTAWTGITTFLTSIWMFISTTAMSVWNGIKTFFTTIWDGIVSVVTSVWTGISTFLNTVWNGIKTVASIVWTGLKVLIAGIAVAILVAVTGPFGALAIFVAANFNTIKSIASSVWNSIKSVISSVVNTIKSVVTSAWNAIKSVTSSVWNSIKSLTSSAWNGIKSVISSGINAARSVVSSAVNAMRSAATSAWNAMKSAASSVVSGIKSAFHSLASINLGAAGRAIMNSFLGGLRAAWGNVKSFVGGIAGWIKAHKGPISYDRRLLIPAGKAIMNGLNAGLIEQFKTVQKSVGSMAGSIADTASNAINSNIQALNANVSGSYNGSLTVQDSSLQMQNNALLRTIAGKNTDLYLDGNTLVGGTANRMDNALGNNTRLRGRLS